MLFFFACVYSWQFKIRISCLKTNKQKTKTKQKQIKKQTQTPLLSNHSLHLALPLEWDLMNIPTHTAVVFADFIYAMHCWDFMDAEILVYLVQKGLFLSQILIIFLLLFQDISRAVHVGTMLYNLFRLGTTLSLFVFWPVVDFHHLQNKVCFVRCGDYAYLRIIIHKTVGNYITLAIWS